MVSLAINIAAFLFLVLVALFVCLIFFGAIGGLISSTVDGRKLLKGKGQLTDADKGIHRA